MVMIDVTEHLKLLGHRVRDRVSGFEGVVDHVGFDLYGCIQVTVNPGLDKDKKPISSHWFDVKRLEKLSKKPVMEVPMFTSTPSDEIKGGFDKPASPSRPAR